MRRDLGDRAVVLGGSMAGCSRLGCWRSVSPPSSWSSATGCRMLPEPRRGVPQGKHIHGLLAGGQQAFEQLLPGLTRDLAADGVPIGDPLADLRLSINGHRFRQAPSGLTLVSPSREMLEHHLRRRVRALPNLTVTDGCDVVGLAETGGRITGVRVLRRADHSVEESSRRRPGRRRHRAGIPGTGLVVRHRVPAADRGAAPRRPRLHHAALPPAGRRARRRPGPAAGPDPCPSSGGGAGPPGGRRVDADLDRPARRSPAGRPGRLRPFRRIGGIGRANVADPHWPSRSTPR